LRRKIETKTGRRISIAGFYVTMDRLLDEGLIEKETLDHPDPEVREARGGHKVNQYRLTEQGRRKRDERLAAKSEVVPQGLHLA
jgi:DNA-binding PadR family transcriptional regulator